MRLFSMLLHQRDPAHGSNAIHAAQWMANRCTARLHLPADERADMLVENLPAQGSRGARMTAQPSEREAMDRILEQQACDQSRRLVRSSEREARVAAAFAATRHGILCPQASSTGFCNCDHKYRAAFAFADRERADEREAEKERCARVAEQSGNEIDTDSHAESGRLIAAAIRNRKDENDG